MNGPKRRWLTGLIAAATMATASLVSPSPAAAALTPEEIPPIPACSDDLRPPDALFVTCVELHLNSGQAKFGSVETTVSGPIVVRKVFATKLGPGGLEVVEVPQEGGGGLSFPTVVVPGGLFGGIPILEDLDLGPLTGVTATIIPAGELTTSPVNVGAVLNGTGRLTTATIPLYIQLNNTLLGDTCTIGTAADPILLNLDLDLSGGLQQAHFADLVASDTTFAIPAARDCGLLGTGALLNDAGLGAANVFDLLVNNKAGLPSPSGNNYLTFDGVFAAKAVMPE